MLQSETESMLAILEVHIDIFKCILNTLRKLSMVDTCICVCPGMCVWELMLYLVILLENNIVKLNLHFIINLAFSSGTC